MCLNSRNVKFKILPFKIQSIALIIIIKKKQLSEHTYRNCIYFGINASQRQIKNAKKNLKKQNHVTDF